MSHVVGYLFAVVVGYFMVGRVAKHAWIWMEEESPTSWTSGMLGGIERIIYVASLQLGKGEVIGFWLAVKVAGQWIFGQEKEPGDAMKARKVHNIVLIGNGLSILYAVVGFKMIGWLDGKDWGPAILVPLSLLLATVFCSSWIGREIQKKRA